MVNPEILTLTKLNLSDNNIIDSVAKVTAAALSQNMQLNELEITL